MLVHQLTKYAIHVPCTKQSLGADLARICMDNVYVHLGLPTHTLSDRGTQFTGVFRPNSG